MKSLLGCLLTLVALAGGTRNVNGSRPHLVHVMMDDLGWGLVGFHDSPEVQTPVLDSLAADGVVLDRHYAHKICSPSRCALQTGRAPIHVNVQNVAPTVHNADDPQGGYQGIPMNMTCIAQHLKRAGYSTHMVGKWDVGMATPAHHPTSRGFDTWLGYWHHANDYWSQYEGECANSSAAGEKGLFSHKTPVRDLWRFNADHDGPATSLANDAACSAHRQHVAGGTCEFEEALFTSEVIGLVAAHDLTTPLFLLWSMHLVHFPLQPPHDFEAQYATVDDIFRRKMAAMVSYMDQAIGALVDALQARPGMWDNTLLVLHTDNGGEIMFDGSCGGNNFPLRGGKFSNWEGGVRTVALAGGGFLPPSTRGRVETSLVTVWDWYATYAFLAGVDPTDHAAAAVGLPAHDSINAWPVLVGEGGERMEIEIGDSSAIYYNGDGQTLVGGLIQRRDDGRLFKVLVGSKDLLRRIPQDVTTPQLYPNGTFFPQLSLRECGRNPNSACMFDLEADPTETTNLATDPQFRGAFFEMLARIDELQETVYSPVRGWRADPTACEKAMKENGAYWGPWLPVPTTLAV